jgi:hypothetical protein
VTGIYKCARQIKTLVEEELYTACKKYVGCRTDINELQRDLQKICDETYMYRKCPVLFKVHMKAVAGRVVIDLEPVYWESIPLKDGN